MYIVPTDLKMLGRLELRPKVLGAYVVVADSFAGIALCAVGSYLAAVGVSFGIAQFVELVIGRPALLETRRRERVQPRERPNDLDQPRTFAFRVSSAVVVDFVSNYYLFVYLPSVSSRLPAITDPIPTSAVFVIVYMTEVLTVLASPASESSGS